MSLRSMLFVPGDSEKKIAKAATGDADALILDIEDSVTPDRKPFARKLVAATLKAPRKHKLWVRINPLDSEYALDDLVATVGGKPDCILLPKANDAGDVVRLDRHLTEIEKREGVTPGAIKVVVLANETGASMFTMGS